LRASRARALRTVIATVALLACGDSSSPTGPGGGNGGGVAQIAITPNAPTVTLGSQLSLQADVRNANGVLISGASVFWSSADTSIVSVTSAGVITGKSIGSTQVAASSGGKSARAVVTVQAAPVASISIAPSTATLVVGGTTTLQAVLTDAAGQPLTGRPVAWASNATQVATVDASGKVIGVAAGTATITATSETKTGTATITVTVTPIAAIAVMPSAVALKVGESTGLTAIATDANQNVLGGRPMTWASSDSTIAIVSTRGLVTAVAPGTATITASGEGRSGTAQVVVTAAAPTPVGSVALTPTSASLIIGGTTTISATIRDDNGAVLTGRAVTWSSSATGIATVSSSGIVTAVAPGSATITATCEGKTGTATITVSAVPVASIAVTPASANIVVGATTSLTAVTKDADGNVLAGRVVAWTSSAPSIATVSASGVVTGVAAGNATITATSEGKTATSAISVALAPVATITLDPTTVSLVVGSATGITAVLKDANDNVLTGRTIAWTSATPGVATVDANGTVTAVAAGSATITAKSEGKSATVSVNVSLIPVASVVLAPTLANVFVNEDTTIVATVKDANGNQLHDRVVTWASSDAGVATVVNGLVTGVAAGTTTITATSEGQTSAGATIIVHLKPVATVTINPSTVSLDPGGTATLSATLKSSDGETLSGRAITWTSNNPTVGATGGVITTPDTGNAVVTVTITATSEGKSGTATLTLNREPVATVDVAPTGATLDQGDSTTLVATPHAGSHTLTNRTITWASSDTHVATVDAAGLVKAAHGGTATITATIEGKTDNSLITVQDTVASVVIDQASVSVAKYKSVTATATVKNDAGAAIPGQTVSSWNSTNPSIASINTTTGVVTGVLEGTTTITASKDGITSAPVTVTVNPAAVASISINELPATIALPEVTQTTFTATTLDQNGQPLTGRTITWASGNPTVATVDPSSGVVTAHAAGTANITATSETVASTPVAVTVTLAPVTSVVIDPGPDTLYIDSTRTLTATLTDAASTVLSGRVISWSSSDPTIATIDDATGVVHALAAGSTTITATSETVTSPGFVLNVAQVPVNSVSVAPLTATLSAATSETTTLTATALDVNGNPLAGRAAPVWSSSDETIATVNAATGVVTAVAQGSATITATIEGKTGTASITVGP
jgi:uncharacterized protein YjdB